MVGTDQNTHIMNITRTVGCSSQDVLEQVCSEMAEAMKVVTEAMEAMPEIRVIWKEFVNGYITWHIHHDRYRLKELGIVVA